MKKKLILFCIIVFIISSALYKHQKRTITTASLDPVVIVEKHESYLLVSSLENENELTELDVSKNTFFISDGNKISFGELKKGDIIYVIYDGQILERFPGVINTVFAIEVIND